jgi:hypothetical protein
MAKTVRFPYEYKPREQEDASPNQGRFCKNMARDGGPLDPERCQPGANGGRVHHAGGRIRVTDGPFTETKELIRSFAVTERRPKRS